MLTAPAETITSEQIAALLRDQTPEGRTLDYKRELSLATPEDRRELARDVASFANASGGFLVLGITEDKGVPTEICGMPCPDFDAFRLRVDNILRDSIQPRVPGLSYVKIDSLADHPVIVIHVPQSWNGPHMAAAPNQGHFYSRNSAGKFALDVSQIRSAFVAGTEVADRIRRFRDERIGRVLAGEGAMPMLSGPLLVVHVVPLTNADGVFDGVQRTGMRPAPECPAWSNRFNLDGYVAYTPGEVAYGYTMALRNGAFEGVQCQSASGDVPPMMYGYGIEGDLLFCVEMFTKISRATGYAGPLVVLASLMGCKGKRILANLQGFATRHDPAHTVDRDVLALPDVTFEEAAPRPTVLRPIFDALWQAGGAPGSPSYAHDGTWTDPRRRR